MARTAIWVFRVAELGLCRAIAAVRSLFIWDRLVPSRVREVARIRNHPQRDSKRAPPLEGDSQTRSSMRRFCIIYPWDDQFADRHADFG